MMHTPIFSRAVPRAMIGRVRAETDTTTIIRRLEAGFEEFKATHEGRYAALEAHLDDLAKVNAATKLNGGGGGGVIVAADPKYSAAFATYFRNGSGEQAIREANASGQRAQINAAMSVGSNPDGGYLAPTEWDRNIQQAQVIISPMRQIAQVRTTSVGAYSTLWNTNQWGSGWVGETASRPTTSSDTLASLVFNSGEIYSNVAVSQRLLDDAQVDFGAWLADQVTTEFSRQEGIAFVSGDGANKPQGFLTYAVGGSAATLHPGGPLDVAPSGNAATIAPDSLVDFFYGLSAPYRQNAVWVMNSLTAAVISKLKDGQGNYLWREAFMADQPATLLGRPVVIDEGMPNVAAGALAVAFGDFRAGYIINDRLGTRILRDPYTMKPFVLFYVTKRVGGGVLDPRAIRVMKIAVS